MTNYKKMHSLKDILHDISNINNIVVDETVNDDDEDFEGFDLFVASRRLKELLVDLPNDIDIDLIRKINAECCVVCEYASTRIPCEDVWNLERLYERLVEVEDDLYCF